MAVNQAHFKNWFVIALSPSIVKRAACYALVVGSLLILINHGACILDDMFSPECFLQSVLSAIVPYLVVTVSSVQATISNENRNV